MITKKVKTLDAKRSRVCSTDLSVEQFKMIEKYLPKTRVTRPKIYSNIDKFNAMLYVLHTGCQWRELPERYPPFRIVHKFFRKLCVNYTLEKIVKSLNTCKVFKKRNKVSYPDAVLLIDSKSVRVSEYYNGINKGYDGHKKIKGLKLCPVIDRARRLWSLQAFPANTPETECFKIGLERSLMPSIKPYAKYVIGDRYFDNSKFKYYTKKVLNLDTLTLKRFRIRKKDKEVRKDFLDLKLKRLIADNRYIIEQFFSHLEKARRLVIVYERKTSSYIGFVNLRVIQLMIKRLTRK